MVFGMVHEVKERDDTGVDVEIVNFENNDPLFRSC